ncbi:hypothetical protein AB3S75_031142 [Citrus x aurantiifolia]
MLNALGVSGKSVSLTVALRNENGLAEALGSNFDYASQAEIKGKWHPRCDLLIRIKALDDSKAVCPQAQDSKCGAYLVEIGALLEAALASQLGVVGVSFHIGSGATDFGAFDGAISAAKAVFDAASARHGLTDQMRAKHWRWV